METAVLEEKIPGVGVERAVVAVVDPLEDTHWDLAVRSFPGATIFHSAAWARVLRDTYRYRPQYLVAYRDHDLAGVLPLMEIHSAFTGTRGVSLPFTDFCPPLARDAEAVGALLAKAQGLAHARQWRYLDLRDFAVGAAEAPALTFLEHTLDLTDDPELLAAGLRPELRRAIRKAEKAGLSCSSATGIGAVGAFYRLHCMTRRRHGLPVQPFSFFRNIHEHLLTAGLGFVILARTQGQPVAGGLFLHFGTHAMYKFGASDPAHMSLRGNNLAMWQGILACAARGATTLSMGKTPPDQDGLARFKASFGATEATRSYLRWEPASAQWTPPDDSWTGFHNRLFQHLPIPALRMAGELLYKHVG